LCAHPHIVLVLEKQFFPADAARLPAEKGLEEAIHRLKPFFCNTIPFVNPPRIREKIQWVKPMLVCEVAFAEWTEEEQLRQTSFLGMARRHKCSGRVSQHIEGGLRTWFKPKSPGRSFQETQVSGLALIMLRITGASRRLPNLEFVS